MISAAYTIGILPSPYSRAALFHSVVQIFPLLERQKGFYARFIGRLPKINF
jgi:hypothetical protein